MSNIYNDVVFEARFQWLTDRGLKPKDVMSDEQGEYVYVEFELGDAGDIQVMKHKVYLPNDIQIHD